MTYKLYDILGLNFKDHPTENDIKRSYKKQAMIYHPDKNKDNPKAEEKFKEISNAYDILCDENKKRVYDQVGDEGYNNETQDSQQMRHNDVFEHFFKSRGGNPFSHNPFGFDGFDGFGEMDRDDVQSRTINKIFSISLDDVFHGINKNISLNISKYCFECMKKCENCNGTGTIKQMKSLGFLTQVFTGSCHICNASGYKNVSNKSCSTCQGNGKFSKEVNAVLSLPKGINDGYSTLFEKMGEQPKNPNQKAGNLVLEIKVQEHKHFKRNGNDLIYKCSLTFIQSIIGHKVQIPYFDKEFELNTIIFGVVHPGKQYLIQGKGLPILENANKMGNMFIEFDIKYPKIKNDIKIKELEILLKETFEI